MLRGEYVDRKEIDMHQDTHKSRLVAAVIASAALGATFALSACNTTEGVGEDISAAGDALDDAAEDSND